MAVSTGGIVTIVYGSTQLLLLLVLTIKIYYLSRKRNDNASCRKLMWSLWKERGVYSPAVLHIYDTATDIGVLYEWYKLAEYERNGGNLESLDMEQFFWIAIGFMIAYRAVSALFGMFFGFVHAQNKSCLRKLVEMIGGFIAGLLELNIFITIYVEQTDSNPPEGAGPAQKLVQLMEGILESLPEVIMQSVFLMRAVNDERLDKAAGDIYWLVIFSIFASLLSITSKYVWIDEYMMTPNAKSIVVKERDITKRVECKCGLKRNSNTFDLYTLKYGDISKLCAICNDDKNKERVYICPNVDIYPNENFETNTAAQIDFSEHPIVCIGCHEDIIVNGHSFVVESRCYTSVYISIGFLMRLLWRLAAVTARFVIFALVWVVIGGAFVIVIFPSMIIVWYILVIIVASFTHGNVQKIRQKCNCNVYCCYSLIGCCKKFAKALLILLAMILVGIVFQLGILGISGRILYIVRMIENVILMTVVSVFAFASFDCKYCADATQRSAMNNDRILIWIIVGWISIIIHIITSFFVTKYIRRGYEYNVENVTKDFYDIVEGETTQKDQRQMAIQLQVNISSTSIQ